MSENQIPEEDYVASITPDVMAVLAARGFFDALDEALCPTDAKPPVTCRTNYENSERILIELGFERDDFEDIFDVLRGGGGFCDCEILYNVVETSRLKSKYWRAQADRLERERRGE
jgi:hypothetical protein